MLPAKRRRLDQPNEFFNKPFRSPLRTASKGPQHEQQAQGSTAKSPHASNEPSPLTRPVNLTPANSEASNIQHRDPPKQHSALSLHLKKLCQTLDVAHQALQIETSGQDVRLQALITKWKAVAQEVAEQLFVLAKERIDQMGGVSAWRRCSQENARLWHRDVETDLLASDVNCHQHHPQMYHVNDVSVSTISISTNEEETEPSVSRQRYPPLPCALICNR